MVARRTILKLSAVGVAGAVVGDPIQLFGALPALSKSTMGGAVFDQRFVESLTFAGEMRGRGLATSAFRADVARLWYDDLHPRLREHRAPIAGLTDRVTLFCLEELARDVGMSVVFRVDHLVDASGRVQHEATGPAAIVDATRTLAGGSRFGRAMAGLACRCEVSGPREIAAQKRTGPFSPEHKTALVSWLIA